MYSNLFVVALSAFALTSAAPLEARDGLSSPSLEVALLGAGLSYHAVGEDIRLTGFNGKGGDAVISAYSAIVSGGAGGLPPRGNEAAFPQAVQFALCDAQTTAVLQILETLTLFKINIKRFTPSQVTKIAGLLKQDMKEDKSFESVFAGYVPTCASAIAANGNATQASYASAIKIYTA